MIPGAGQWKLHTELYDESWYSGMHILTLFIWSPRFGMLTCNKDESVVKHYKDQMDVLFAEDDFMP